MSPAATIIVKNSLAELERASHALDDFGHREGLPPKTIFELNLAVNEILTNIVTYGYDDAREHDIVVRLATGAGEVTVEIEDDGRPFDPSTVPAPAIDLPPEQRPVGGLGIHLVRTVMDSVEHRRRGGRNLLVMRKKTAPANR